jgi:glycosyltransferase involved in cell wall biosynthesis
MPTIGIITETSGWGGTEIHTAAVAGALAARGNRVRLIQLGHEVYDRQSPSPWGAGVTTAAVPRPAGSMAGRVRFWHRLFAAQALDRVVLAKCDFGVRWPCLDLAMLRSQRRLLRIEHSLPPDLHALKPRRRLGDRLPGVGLWYWRHLARLALHRAASDQVITVSGAMRERLVGEYGYRAEQVTAIPNGVDAGRFRPDPGAATRARERWGIPGGAYVIGTVARLAPVKRLERLLQAFRMLLQQSEAPCYLVLVGDGTEGPALKTAAVELGIAAHCVWPGPTEQPWLEYPGFDCFAMTSEIEGLPYSLLEAMACECLPVAMAIPGVSEVVTDGVTGRLVEPDVAAYARALREVMEVAPERRRAMGAGARRHVLTHHEERRQIERVCEVILRAGAGSAA